MQPPSSVANVLQRDERADFVRRALRATAIAAVVALAILLLVLEGRVLMLVLAGVLFALFLRASSSWIARRAHVPYAAALAVLALLLAAGIALGTWYLGARIVDQAQALAQQLPDAWHKVVDQIRQRPALQQVIGPVGAEPPHAPPDAAQKVVNGAAGAIGGIGEGIGALVVVFFLGLYGAAQPEAYTRVALKLVPLRHRDRASLVVSEIGIELTRWLMGRLVAMAFVGVFTGIGLALLKIPMAVPLGVLAGLLTFVEYLGAVASAIPACLLALAHSPLHAVWVVLLFTAVHVIEGYLLTPLLARTTVRFPPGYTLVGQVVLGSIFGVAGLTFATPTAVIATILVRRLYVEDALGDRIADDEVPTA